MGNAAPINGVMGRLMWKLKDDLFFFRLDSLEICRDSLHIIRDRLSRFHPKDLIFLLDLQLWALIYIASTSRRPFFITILTIGNTVR